MIWRKAPRRGRLRPGAGYVVGDLAAATVRLLDRPIDHWRHAQFSALELANPETSGDYADLDADGITNLAEYALALDPHVYAPLAPDATPGQLTLSYSCPRSATDVTVTAEGSYDLIQWGTAGVVEEISRLDQGDTERITVRLVETASPTTCGFLRLRVER